MRPKLTPGLVPKHPTLTELPACEDRVIASTVGTAVLELARLLTGVAAIEAITLPLQLLPRAWESAKCWLSPSPATKISAPTPTGYTPRAEWAILLEKLIRLRTVHVVTVCCYAGSGTVSPKVWLHLVPWIELIISFSKFTETFIVVKPLMSLPSHIFDYPAIVDKSPACCGVFCQIGIAVDIKCPAPSVYIPDSNWRLLWCHL